MTFDKKTIITIVASVAGVIVLWGIIGFATHARNYERGFERGFEGNFGNVWCSNLFQWRQTDMMSGIDNIITTKDYAAFQTLFSGSRMLEQIDTPEKFATWIELQTNIKKTQELQLQLWSGNNQWFGPMMIFGDERGRNLNKQIGRWNIRRWGMMGR